MADETMTDEELEALVKKLNAAGLTEKEQSFLGTIFATAAPGEVEGFGIFSGLLGQGVSPEAAQRAIKTYGSYDSMYPPGYGTPPEQRK